MSFLWIWGLLVPSECVFVFIMSFGVAVVVDDDDDLSGLDV